MKRTRGNQVVQFPRILSEMVGYQVKSTFHPIYEACFDKNLVRTHYVQHRITPNSVFRQNGLKRPQFTEGTLFGKIRMNEVYKMNSQVKTLDAILGPKMGDHYLSKIQFLSRGHLAANADYATSALIRATFHYVNTAPQWMRGNAGDWAALEEVSANNLYTTRVTSAGVRGGGVMGRWPRATNSRGYQILEGAKV
uniref:SFRICE_021734 n=1 Tax=Spodoptera frugiperda TaxID=7108 RepID=A0A2H1WIS3_SPOFR